MGCCLSYNTLLVAKCPRNNALQPHLSQPKPQAKGEMLRRQARIACLFVACLAPSRKCSALHVRMSAARPTNQWREFRKDQIVQQRAESPKQPSGATTKVPIDIAH